MRPGFSEAGASFPAPTPFTLANRAPAELSQRLLTFRLLRGERAGRGPRRQLSDSGERAAIHGTQTKENTMSTKKHTIYVINTERKRQDLLEPCGGRLREQGRELHVQARHPSSDEVPASRGKPLSNEEAAAEYDDGPRQPGRPALVAALGQDRAICAFAWLRISG